ncbi:39_t:CDS:2, partial [Racocetra persica]
MVLEGYINIVIEGNEETFKNKAQTKVLDEEDLFRLYCEKIFIDFFHLVDINSSMSREIGECKHIVYQISSLFKFYERTFSLVEFDWIESYAHAAKILKSSTNSGIVKVDIKGTRVSDGLDIFHMEVAGPLYNVNDKHIADDTKKTMRTDILNLITILRNHLDCLLNLATKIRVYSILSINARLTLYSLSMLNNGRFLISELATAVIPFSFNGRSQYKHVLRLMAILH